MGPNFQSEVKGVATPSIATNTQDQTPEMDCNPDGVSHGCFTGACALCLGGGSSSTTPDPNSASAAATPRRRRGDGRSSGGTPSTAARVTRANFASLTAQSLLPNAQFTDHESIPPLDDARSNFLAAYPQYADSDTADTIRNREYRNLSSHVCLDYSGLGLFSHAQGRSMVAPSPSSPPAAPSTSYSYSNFRHPPSFTIAYKSTSLKSQVLGGDAKPTATSAASGVGRLEAALRARIMEFLHLSHEDYHMVITANRASAFKLLAESYPFHTNKRLLTVYDYESEAVTTMVDSAVKRDAKPVSASFTWPSMRVNSSKLKKAVVGSGSGAKKGKKRTRGLFVFPLQSRVTGARYSYLWMSLAQEHGWHVLLDACALGPKDMDTLGLSLFRPDFLICSFFKVFGENPSGFACLFVKRSVTDVVESSALARSVGVVRIVPTRSLAGIPNYNSDDPDSSQVLDDDCDMETTRSFSGPISTPLSVQGFAAMMGNGSTKGGQTASSKKKETNGGGKVGTSEIRDAGAVSDDEDDGIGDSPTASTFSFRPPTPPRSDSTAGIFIEDETDYSYRQQQRRRRQQEEEEELIECRGLDHADSLGLATITGRLRCIINWLVLALTKLRHPHSENAHSLVRIYGPKVKFDRGPALAFNVFDWKGEKIDPTLVQKLADRSNISLTCGFLHNIWFPEKYEADKAAVLEKRVIEQATGGGKKKEKADFGVAVVTASLGFLASFEDAYRVWAFVAKFLDADFVEKERWRYMALNQKMVEV